MASQPASPELLIAAASDIAPLERPLAEAFQKASGHRLRFSFGASGMLARQIEHGAPYDAYLSANEQFVHNLVGQDKLLADSVRLYAVGWLGIWSKRHKIGKLEDLRPLGRIAIANPAHAPYGAAARQALERAGIWKELAPKLVFGENVRQALQYAESGNADAVITAWSLVLKKGGVQVPAALHDPIRQAGAVLKSSRRQAAARRFLEFLASPAGREILTGFGFGVDPR